MSVMDDMAAVVAKSPKEVERIKQLVVDQGRTVGDLKRQLDEAESILKLYRAFYDMVEWRVKAKATEK